MRIYVASSWRNELQPAVVNVLRSLGHAVYDFRHPAPWEDSADPTDVAGYRNTGFSWSEIDPAWKDWTPQAYRLALQHPIAARGYGSDITALRTCDACVLVLPSGRSASWEFGYAMAKGKRAVVAMFERCEPELMYREATIVTTPDELVTEIGAA